MNMGQRFLQLSNTYTVSDNGTITLHCAQMPPYPNIFQPGPAFTYLVVNGVPSNGQYIIIGSGDFGTQTLAAVANLPASVNSTVQSSGNNGGGGSGGSGGGNGDDTSSLSTGVKIGIAAGGAVVILFLGGLIALFIRRRNSRTAAERAAAAGGTNATPGMSYRSPEGEDAFIPLQNYNNSAWDINASRGDLHAPALYSDEPRSSQDTRYTSGAHEQKVEYDDKFYDAPPPPQDPRMGNRGHAM